MSEGRVLVVDDDEAFRFAIRKALRRAGFEIDEAASGEEAVTKLGQSPPDAVLLDLRMRGMDGLEVLRRRASSTARFIVLTGHGSVQAAVEAMQLGAFSFLEKPVDAEELEPLLRQAIGEARRAREKGADDVPPLVGRSVGLEQVRHFVQTVGPTDATVTIFGETGTGKEVVARHVHAASKRSRAPFVALNAATVPRDLFESELFGHKRGSFTGAVADRKGLFREADGGTLFIDELAELPIDSQAKLLRALEARKVRAVGDGRETDVDVRIVAATNRDLWSEVNAGRFREDLYFRLQVFPIVLPPLRSRPDDVAPLAEHLLGRLGFAGLRLDDSALVALRAYDWPGNVRELLNVLRRASLFAQGGILDGELVRRMIAASVFGHATTSARRGGSTFPEPREERTSDPGRSGELPLPESASLAEVERAHIERVLAAQGGNITKAAIALGIDRRTLQRKLKAYGMEGEG
ncbi:MAG: sigma-54-dependent Fis family transcriptional regulator [Sandaracinus sp.]|nr:sigma-54-dependent Fis family transcriptional regulator [Sandaracinus sp.]